jgi:hypothetical protein
VVPVHVIGSPRSLLMPRLCAGLPDLLAHDASLQLHDLGKLLVAVVDGRADHRLALHESGVREALIGPGVPQRTATIDNNTISFNAAEFGGGNNANGSVTISSSTIASNTLGVAQAGGGIFVGSGARPSVSNTVIAANAVDNCFALSAASPLLDGGFNIDDGTSCSLSAAGSRSSTNPLLDPDGLKGNGGSTSNIALTSGSPRSTQFRLASTAAARH